MTPTPPTGTGAYWTDRADAFARIRVVWQARMAVEAAILHRPWLPDASIEEQGATWGQRIAAALEDLRAALLAVARSESARGIHRARDEDAELSDALLAADRRFALVAAPLWQAWLDHLRDLAWDAHDRYSMAYCDTAYETFDGNYAAFERHRLDQCQEIDRLRDAAEAFFYGHRGVKAAA